MPGDITSEHATEGNSPATPSQGAILEADRIGRRHPNGQSWLLQDVSLVIGPATRLVLAGPSGAGKTLLLRALARLDPLDCGEVRYRGQPLHHDAIPPFRSMVVYVHQRATLIEETVEAALQKPYSLKVHRQRKFDRGRAVDLLSALERDERFLGKKVADLSGGEMQVAALVRVLQLDPMILLLDEPTAALDGPTAVAAEVLIDRWLNQNPQRAMVWVSHDEAQAGRVGRTRVIMEGGRMKHATTHSA